MTPSKPAEYCNRWGWQPNNASISNGMKCTSLLLMAIYVWFLPIGHTIAIRHLAFFGLILLTIWSAWRNNLKPQFPIASAWIAYAVIALLSITYAIDPAYTLGEIQQEIGYCILALILGTTWINNTQSFDNLIRIIIIGMLLMVGYALYNGFIVTPFWRLDTLPQIRSLNNGVGTFSTYLITTIPFLIAFAWLTPVHKRAVRAALIFLLLASIAALFLTSNRMGFLALGVEAFVGVSVLFYFRNSVGFKPLITLILLGCIVTGGFVAIVKIRAASQSEIMLASSATQTTEALPPPPEDERLQIWRIAAENIKAQPYTGGGFGIEAFKMRNPEFIRTRSLNWHAHNMVLNKGVQMGIPGMLVFLALFGATFYAVLPTKRLLSRSKSIWVYAVAGSSMVVGMFAKNMTDDFFTNDPALLFWLLIGALVGCIRYYIQDKASDSAPDKQK